MRVSSTTTRPADTTAYAAGDLVANNISAGSVTPFSWAFNLSGNLRRVVMDTSNATITNGTFNLWLLNSAPTMTNGDNGAIAGAVLSTVIAVIPIDLDFSMGGTGGHGESFYDPGLIQCGNGTIYGVLEATAAYAPASAQTITISLELAP